MTTTLASRSAWLALAATAACSAPAAPPAPDESLQPPRYLAADCLPVSEIARQHDVTTNAFLADLDEGRSCEIFLEQDECVLAIFRDCSYDASGTRQWVGEATPGTNGIDVVLKPTFAKAPGRTPPRQCTGNLAAADSPRAGTKLTCDGGSVEGLYIERKDFSVMRFGERMPDEMLVLGSFGTVDALPDMVPVTVSGATEIWQAVNWSGGPAGGGVYRVKGTATAPTVELVDAVSRARSIAASPEGLVVAASGDEMIEEMDLQVYDANMADSRRAKVGTATTADTIVAIAGASDNRFLVAGKLRVGTDHEVKLYAFDRATMRLRYTGRRFPAERAHIIQSVVWSKPATAQGAAFMVAMTLDGSDDGLGLVVGLDDDLQPLWRTQPGRKFDVRSMKALPGQGRVALILAGGERDYDGADQSNHYYEIDPATGTVDPVVALPFADTEELAYDPLSNRVYIAQRYGVVGYVERTGTVRAAQGYFKLDRPDAHTDVVITALAWDPSRQRLTFADPLRGVIDSIRITNP